MSKLKIILIMLLTTTTAFIIFILIPENKNNTPVSGIKLRSSNWSGTIRIKEDTYFAPWATLTIKPATKILFEKKPDIEGTDWTKYADEFIKKHNDPTGKKGYNKTHFELYAKIIALGTKDSPIIFTSAQNKPEYADWDQLILLNGSKLEYVELSYAHNGANIDGNNVTIKNSRIHDSLWSCIDIFSTNNTVENNEIYHCWHQAVGTKKEGPNTIVNNYIHDSQLSVNCENESKPTVSNNIFKAAPLNSECNNDENNKIESGEPDTIGGTYNGKLIYPSNEH